VGDTIKEKCIIEKQICWLMVDIIVGMQTVKQQNTSVCKYAYRLMQFDGHITVVLLLCLFKLAC